MSAPAISPVAQPAPKRQPYVPALGPKMKGLLTVVFASFALLAATGAYLGAVTALNAWRAPETYTSAFTLWMFLAHGVLGIAALVPFLVFGGYHWLTAKHRSNRRAVRLGKLVFVGGVVVCLTGVALFQLEGLPQLPTGTWTRTVVYALHLVVPFLLVVAYIAHRRAGPPIKWRYGYGFGGVTGLFIAGMLVMHWQEPQKWFAVGPAEGDQYFFPSSARTADGNFIPAHVLMMDHYCMSCHQDVYDDWFHSAHHFSSFNNPPYLFSVRETRQDSMKHYGNVKASRWCAGCHDPVPFFSGAFDDPKFDDVHHPTAHAGITCVACHAITHLHDTTGNAAFTIGNPPQYPFTFSDNELLKYLNQQLIKAKPDFHKKTFLKPFHKTAEFCSTCHKVSLPPALTQYREFQRGQNHYDTFHLSGVSGHGARSFYYPPVAKTTCADCHMPLEPSTNFAARDFDGSGVRKRHSHLFPAANTGLPALLQNEKRYAHHDFGAATEQHAAFLRDNKVRIDLFALKEGGTIEGKLLGPLRPALPALQPGKTYLVEVVIRTINLGHHFSQGTVDSNEIWVEFIARSGGRLIGSNGHLDPNATQNAALDPWAHRVNVLMLDREGNRINRRNPQDIFTPLYDHQIPPGAAQVVHYQLTVPRDVTGPIELSTRLRYRKFDAEYLHLIYKDKDPNTHVGIRNLPIVDMCSDQVTLPVAGVAASVPAQASPIKPAWQRWNDYGIGCLLEGGAGAKRGEPRQAVDAFRMLLTLGEQDAVPHAHVNLARVLIEEGRLVEAAAALEKARTCQPPAPWWLVAWFSGVVQAEQARSAADLDKAIQYFEQIVDPANQPRERKFDFTQDYVVLDRLAQTLFRRSQMEAAGSSAQRQFLQRSITRYQQALALDPEMIEAHFGANQAYARLASDAVPITPSDTPSATSVQSAFAALSDRSQPLVQRRQGVSRYVSDLNAWCQQPLDVHHPRLPTLQQYVKGLAALYNESSEPSLQSDLATALSVTHLQIHTLLKPDELAKARAIRIYRSRHPAASAAADAIVIYPTEHDVPRLIPPLLP